MAMERQSLETGMLLSPTILMAKSTVWSFFPTLVHGQTPVAQSRNPLSAIMVSFQCVSYLSMNTSMK